MKLFSLILSLITILVASNSEPANAAPVCRHNEELINGLCTVKKQEPDPKTIYDQQKETLKKIKSELSHSKSSFIKFNNDYKLLFEHSRHLIAKLLEEKYRLKVKASYYTRGQLDNSLSDPIIREYKESVKAVFDIIMAAALQKNPAPNTLSIHVKGGCAQRGCWVKHSDHAEIPDFIELSDFKEYLNISTATSCSDSYKRAILVNGKKSGIYKCYTPNQNIYGWYRFYDHISEISKIAVDEPAPELVRIRMGYAKLQIDQIDQALSYLTRKSSLLNTSNSTINPVKIKHPNIAYLSRHELVNYLEIYRLDDKYPSRRLTAFQNPDSREFNDTSVGFYRQYSLGSLNRLALDACMEKHYRNEELADYCRFILPAYDNYIMSSEIEKLFAVAIAGSIPVFQNILIVDDLIHEGSLNNQFMVWLNRVWYKSINCRLDKNCSPEKLYRYIPTRYEYEEKSVNYPEIMSAIVDNRLEKMADNLYARFSRELHELTRNPQGRPNLVALDQFLGLLKTAVILGRLGYYSSADLNQFLVTVNGASQQLADAGLDTREQNSLENFFTAFTASIVSHDYFNNVEFARIDMQRVTDDINAIKKLTDVDARGEPGISNAQARSFLENMKLETADFINVLAGIINDVPLSDQEIALLRSLWEDHYRLAVEPESADELAEIQQLWFSWEEDVQQIPVYRRLYHKFKSWVNEQKRLDSGEPVAGDTPLEHTDLEEEIYDQFIDDVGIDEDFLNFPRIQVQLRNNLRLFNRYFSDIPANQPPAQPQPQPQFIQDLQDIEDAFPEAGEGSAMIASIAEQTEVISGSVEEIASTLGEFSHSYSTLLSSLGTVTTTASILGSILSSIIPIL